MRTITNRLALTALAFLFAAGTAHAGGYFQINLVSDQPGMAEVTDPNLINPWGISFSTTSPFWVSNQGATPPPAGKGIGTATVYSAPAATTGGLFTGGTALTVTIPNLGGAAPSGVNGPTGQVSTGAPGITTLATDFSIPTTPNPSKAAFIFANMDGSIAAWSGSAGTAALTIPMATIPGASFTGLAIGMSGGSAFLYAADQNSPKVYVFNGSWQNTTTLTDSNLPTGFTAFNVQNINGVIYVTYANPHSELGGIVDVLQPNGTLSRLITDTAGTHLQTPWGITIAPAGFGQFGGDLLVGNNDGDGTINAYTTGGTWVGQLRLADGTVFSQKELWALTFGNNGNGGSSNVLYFDAGLAQAAHGLFGALAVPEPGSAVLGLIALGTVTAGWGWKRRRRAATSARTR